MLFACIAGVSGLLLLFRKRELLSKSALLTAILSLVVIGGSALIPVVIRIAPYSRNFLPLLPFCAVIAGVGMAAGGRWLILKWSLKNSLLVAVVALGVFQVCYLISFPGRLDEYRRAGLPEDVYFLYSSAEFDPGAVVVQVAHARQGQRHYACIMTERAWQNLGQQFAWFELPPVYADTNGHARFLFLIAMSEPRIQELATEYGISEGDLSVARRIELPGFIFLEIPLSTPRSMSSFPNPLGITAFE